MLLYYLLIGIVGAATYLWHVNRSLSGTPDSISSLAGKPFTEEEVKACYRKVEREGLDFIRHLPPKTGRRYIVTGGSGFLGKWFVLHLIQRGEPPSAIRIVDIRDPVAVVAHDEIRGADQFNEYEPLRKAVGSVAFAKADLTHAESVQKAFEAPWPDIVKDNPLTVFHCAAVIRHWERMQIFLPRQAKVNIDGTRNVLAAAKALGATVLISTSSSSVGVRRPNHWLMPWKRWASNVAQVLTDDSPNPPSQKDEFFSNYSFTKWTAENYVREADEKGKRGGLRTGIVRPGNGIYGPGGDFTAGTYLRLGGGPSWIAHIIQDFVHVQNAVLAHLCYERCLINLSTDPKLPDIGGQSFYATDPNPAVRFSDVYGLLEMLSLTKTKFTIVPGIVLFVPCHLVEWYDVLAYYIPSLPKLQFPLMFLQPALFGVSSVHTVVDDRRARTKPEDGGLGYNPPVDTMNGLCFQVLEWNRHVERAKGSVDGQIDVSETEGVTGELEKATAPAQSKA